MRKGVVMLCLSLLNTLSHSQVFQDVSDILNPHTLVNTLYGCGISLYDVNKDGLDDITLGGKSSPILLYLNQGEGVFELHNLGLFFNEEVKALLWADYDNDGDPDLLVSRMFAPVRLYRNDGNFQMTDVSASSGLVLETGPNWGASFGDINNDGFLDLYLCKYVNPVTMQDIYFNWNRFYLNNTDGTFTEMAFAAGVNDGAKMSFQSSFIDFDRDGLQDIYVINDKTSPNSLYRNNGDLTFTEVGLQNGAGIVIDAMSIALGDMDNNGYEDIYITNTQGGNALIENQSGQGFQDVADFLGVAVYYTSWGANFLDADNDGFLDLFVGTQLEMLIQLANQFFHQTPEGYELRLDWFEEPEIATTFASGVFDYNNDGFPEIINSNASPDPVSIFAATPNGNHYLKLGFEGTLANRDGIGTLIESWSCGHYQNRYTHCGEGYLAQNSSYELLGLGQCEQVDSVRLVWLSGVEEWYYNLPADSLYLFKEGSSFQLSLNWESDTLWACPGDSLLLCASGYPLISINEFADTSCIFAHPGQSYTFKGSAFQYWSDSSVVAVQAFELPVPSFLSSSPSCFGYTDGSIALLDTDSFWNGVLWDNGDTLLLTENLTAGIHCVQLSDSNFCQQEICLELLQPLPLELTAIVQQEDEFNPSSASFSPNGGSPPYHILWSNGDTLWNASSMLPGAYTVTVSDANLCNLSYSFEIAEFTGINETSENGIFFTNPFSEILRIESDYPGYLRVFNAHGAELHSSFIRSVEHINTLHWPTGVYILEYSGTHKIQRIKLLRE